MELSGLWRLQQFEVGQMHPLEVAAAWLDDRFWITVKVPGDVHSALIERGLIEDPYFGHNDAKSRWIEQKEWWYRHSFNYTLSNNTDDKEKHELTFEGLDTFATIYVNGKEIGRTSNMLMAHTFDVTRVIQDGRNAIAVKFDPLHLHNKDKELFQWSSYTKERPWLRKAAMNFGWDWGPRMVTVGIWGKVFIERHRRAKLDSVFARTSKISDSRAEIKVDVDVTTLRKGVKNTCDIRLMDAGGHVVASAQVKIRGASGTFTLDVTDPQLWWTHDLGKPYLYELEVILYAHGDQVDTYRKPFGIRTIELQLQDEKGKNVFAFVLNDIKVFAKGTNWIPANHFIGSIPDQRYRDLIDLSVTSNQNMLRVWAGGIYEKDVFYEECDKRGVLVWQDFCFANALFPDFNREFMDNVRQEVIYNIKRLRNYTSLALWCGNNEIDWLYDMKSAGGDINCPFYGEIIYHELIPEALEWLDDSRAYWPSSPYGGNDANDPDLGDRHNWQVWHGSVYPRQFGDVPLLDYSIEGVTFKNYKKDFALFSSEFGMHASANRYTLEKNIPDGQFYWNSVEMAYRNKDTNHQKGTLLMEGYTGIPTNIEEYMNFSMLTQAEGLKYGIEHYRRNKHRTSGSLIWQLNDSWPGTSWSLIDYELLPKASFYYAKKFYHPTLLSIDHEPGQDLAVWAVNDTLSVLEGQVRVSAYNFAGDLLFTHAFEALVPSNAAIQVGRLTEARVVKGLRPEQVVIRVHTADWDAPDNLHYLRDQKNLQFPTTSLSVNVDADTQTVQITANGSHARMVKLDVPQGNIRFSDNFFDLLACQQMTVHISDPAGGKVDLRHLKVSAINS